MHVLLRVLPESFGNIPLLVSAQRHLPWSAPHHLIALLLGHWIPVTKHFRWIYESAYDNKREFKKRFEQVSNDLEARQLSGLAHSKENVSGKRLEVGYFQNSQVRREARHAQGAYRELDWKLRFVLALEKVLRFIPFRFRRW